MSIFRPVRETSQSLDGRIASYIRDLIERGELKPGEQLPLNDVELSISAAFSHMANGEKQWDL